RQGFTDYPGGPSVLVLGERRRTRKQARTATSATDITRYRRCLRAPGALGTVARGPRQAAQARCGIARLAVGVYCFGPGVARIISSTNILPNFAMSTSICACTSGRSRAGLMLSDQVSVSP